MCDNNTNNTTTQGALGFNANNRASQKFYYRDFAQSEAEHYAQNREAQPLQVDVEELREWLVTARPRSSTDAGPMLVLCQNIMKSLLEDKAIVFEKRAKVEREEKETAVAELSQRIAELEAELQQARNRTRLAENRGVELKEKLHEALGKIDKLERDIEQSRELIGLRDKRVASFDNDFAKLHDEKAVLTKQADGLRKGAAMCLRELRPCLVTAQDGALLCSAVGMIGPGAGTPRGHKLLGQTAISDMLPNDPSSFKMPNAPAHNLAPLKLEARLPSMRQVIFALTTKALLLQADFQVATKLLSAAKEGKLEPLQLVSQYPEYLHAREALLNQRESVAALKTFTVEPKHMQVIKSFCYIIGFPKKKLDRWPEMKKLLGPDLFKNLLGLDTQTAKFGTMLKESMTIISTVPEAEVMENSQAVGCMYKVVKELGAAKADFDAQVLKAKAEAKAAAAAEAAEVAE